MPEVTSKRNCCCCCLVPFTGMKSLGDHYCFINICGHAAFVVHLIVHSLCSVSTCILHLSARPIQSGSVHLVGISRQFANQQKTTQQHTKKNIMTIIYPRNNRPLSLPLHTFHIIPAHLLGARKCFCGRHYTTYTPPESASQPAQYSIHSICKSQIISYGDLDVENVEIMQNTCAPERC